MAKIQKEGWAFESSIHRGVFSMLSLSEDAVTAIRRTIQQCLNIENSPRSLMRSNARALGSSDLFSVTSAAEFTGKMLNELTSDFLERDLLGQVCEDLPIQCIIHFKNSQHDQGLSAAISCTPMVSQFDHFKLTISLNHSTNGNKGPTNTTTFIIAIHSGQSYMGQITATLTPDTLVPYIDAVLEASPTTKVDESKRMISWNFNYGVLRSKSEACATEHVVHVSVLSGFAYALGVNVNKSHVTYETDHKDQLPGNVAHYQYPNGRGNMCAMLSMKRFVERDIFNLPVLSQTLVSTFLLEEKYSGNKFELMVYKSDLPGGYHMNASLERKADKVTQIISKLPIGVMTDPVGAYIETRDLAIRMARALVYPNKYPHDVERTAEYTTTQKDE